MCAQQSTYCYPNGCLKHNEIKRKTGNTERPKVENLNPTNLGNHNPFLFLVDKDDGLDNSRYASEGKADAKKSSKFEFRPDIFKDRYSTLFKYKKIPKVELHYNLKEQVKHMKSGTQKIVMNFKERSNTKEQPQFSLERMKSTKIPTPQFEPGRITNTQSLNENVPISATFTTNQHEDFNYAKRDLAKSLTEEDINIKATYLLNQKEFLIDENVTLTLDNLLLKLLNKNNLSSLNETDKVKNHEIIKEYKDNGDFAKPKYKKIEDNPLIIKGRLSKNTTIDETFTKNDIAKRNKNNTENVSAIKKANLSFKHTNISTENYNNLKKIKISVKSPSKLNTAHGTPATTSNNKNQSIKMKKRQLPTRNKRYHNLK